MNRLEYYILLVIANLVNITIEILFSFAEQKTKQKN